MSGGLLFQVRRIGGEHGARETHWCRTANVASVIRWRGFVNAIVGRSEVRRREGWRHHKAVAAPDACVLGVVIVLAPSSVLPRVKVVLRLSDMRDTGENADRVFLHVWSAGPFADLSTRLEHFQRVAQ